MGKEGCNFENFQDTNEIERLCENNYFCYSEEHLLILFSKLLPSVVVILHITASIIILKHE